MSIRIIFVVRLWVSCSIHGENMDSITNPVYSKHPVNSLQWVFSYISMHLFHSHLMCLTKNRLQREILSSLQTNQDIFQIYVEDVVNLP